MHLNYRKELYEGSLLRDVTRLMEMRWFIGAYESRTLQMVNRRGAFEAMKQMVRKQDKSESFLALCQGGYWKLTIEYTVLQYPKLFEPMDQIRALANLRRAGCPMTGWTMSSKGASREPDGKAKS
jgi:hypothetical protein